MRTLNRDRANQSIHIGDTVVTDREDGKGFIGGTVQFIEDRDYQGTIDILLPGGGFARRQPCDVIRWKRG